MEDFNTNKSADSIKLILATKLKYSGSSAPTYIPKTFQEQIYFYLNGATYRVYFWVDGTWKYAALT